MKNRNLILLIIIASIFSTLRLISAQDVSISATVDKNRITLDDQLLLTVKVQGNVQNLPDVVPPEMEAFEIVNSSQSSRISIINFQMTAERDIQYVLVPLKAGKFTIDSFQITVKGRTYKSEPIQVEVVDVGGFTQPSSPSTIPEQSFQEVGDIPETSITQPLAVRAEITSDEVYVGQQILYKFYFYQSLSQNTGLTNAQLEFPSWTGFWSEKVLEKEPYQKIIGRQRYKVNEIDVALFPTTTGALTIESTKVHLTYDPFADFFDFDFPFGRRQQRTRGPSVLATRPLMVKVKPLPTIGKPPGFNGVVGEYEIISDVDKNIVKAGEPITLTLTIRGKGNIKAIPAVQLPELSDFRVYEPKKTEDISRNQAFIQGQVRYEYVLIPKKDGNYTIPSVQFPHFNPWQEKYQIPSSNPIALTIIPGEMREEEPLMARTIITKDQVQIVSGDIRYIKTEVKELMRHKYPFQNLIFQLLVIFPLIALPISILIKKEQNRLREDVVYRRNKKAKGELKKRLKEAWKNCQASDSTATCSAVHKAICGYIADKFNLPDAGLTNPEIKETLLKAGYAEEYCQQVVRLLEKCDFGRFSSSRMEKEELVGLLKEAENILSEIKKGIKNRKE